MSQMEDYRLDGLSSVTKPGKVFPKPDCTDCGGMGQVRPEGAKAYHKCGCVLVQEAHQYLTTTYKGATYIKALNYKDFLKKINYRFEGMPTSRFKSYVKSFLLNSGMRFTHRTVTPQEIITAYVSSDGKSDFVNMKQVQLLILFVHIDPPNRQYGSIMTSIIEERKLRGLPTWLYTPGSVSTTAFGNTYSPEFQALITGSFDLAPTP